MGTKIVTWEEFVESGMYWFVVKTMNIFGWTLIGCYEDSKLVGVVPARVQGTFSNVPLEEARRVAFLREIDPKIAEVLTDPAELPEADRKVAAKVEAMTVEDA